MTKQKTQKRKSRSYEPHRAAQDQQRKTKTKGKEKDESKGNEGDG